MNHRLLSVLRLCSAFTLAAFASSGAYAVDLEKRLGKQGDPALLVAKEVHYDEKTSIATASGDVEIVQGQTILRADHVTYDVNADKVSAQGHVSIMEASGDVFFAENANLTQKMQQGAVAGFQARLKDNSLFAARKGNRVSKDITHLDKLVYSPCKVCKAAEGEKGSPPLWQIQARKATIDEEKKRVSYRDAFFDVYGVPTIYTPYFSHATPDAPSQSGLLTPQYFHATDLGNVVRQPVYLSLAPNMDMTLTPWYFSTEKPMLSGEFRSMFKDGDLRLNAAYTNTYNRDNGGALITGTQDRGYIEGHGRYQLSNTWATGVDAERTTDDTFLQLYRFGWKDTLTSRLYTERISGRNYASVEALSFQGLTQQDDSKLSPTVLPKATFHYESDPQIAHSRATLDSSLLVAEQKQGVSTRRFSGTAGWKIPYITRGGQIFEANATMRGDVYDISDQTTDAATRSTFSGTIGRVIPQIDINWRYPFINRFAKGRTLMIAPIAEMTASPSRHPSSKFPNTDSQATELSDANLFSADRFTGLDQVESGTRFTYGTRGHLQNKDDEWLEWLLGQTYQENSDNTFPITGGTRQHSSDYVGRLGLKYRWFDIAYGFKLDRNSFAPISNNVNAVFDSKIVVLSLNYVSLRDDPVFGNRQEVYGGAEWNMTSNWRFSLNGRRDLGSSDVTTAPSAFTPVVNPLQPTPGTVGMGAALTFHNECLMVTASAGRSYITQQDVHPSTTFGILLTLNNFGETDESGRSVLGAGNVEAVNTTESAVNDNEDTMDEPSKGSTP